MPFTPGQSGNPAGKAKGNGSYKVSAEQRDFLRTYLFSNKAKFTKRMKLLSDRDFVHAYMMLMQYVIPRPAVAEIREVPRLEEFVLMSKEERQVVIQEIQQTEHKRLAAKKE